MPSVIGAVIGGVLAASVGMAKRSKILLVVLAAVGAFVGYIVLGYVGLP